MVGVDAKRGLLAEANGRTTSECALNGRQIKTAGGRKSARAAAAACQYEGHSPSFMIWQAKHTGKKYRATRAHRREDVALPLLEPPGA